MRRSFHSRSPVLLVQANLTRRRLPTQVAAAASTHPVLRPSPPRHPADDAPTSCRRLRDARGAHPAGSSSPSRSFKRGRRWRPPRWLLAGEAEAPAAGATIRLAQPHAATGATPCSEEVFLMGKKLDYMFRMLGAQSAPSTIYEGAAQLSDGLLEAVNLVSICCLISKKDRKARQADTELNTSTPRTAEQRCFLRRLSLLRRRP
nr:uncharacterized protein LOC109733689 [Aegilops tauschii subsp. strangulata]